MDQLVQAGPSAAFMATEAARYFLRRRPRSTPPWSVTLCNWLRSGPSSRSPRIRCEGSLCRLEPFSIKPVIRSCGESQHSDVSVSSPVRLQGY